MTQSRTCMAKFVRNRVIPLPKDHDRLLATGKELGHVGGYNLDLL